MEDWEETAIEGISEPSQHKKKAFEGGVGGGGVCFSLSLSQKMWSVYKWRKKERNGERERERERFEI